ncbi:SDR family NAD(P)-dependent oxidoreductase [Hymenobacter sp. 15J16-1T3B]|uniref:SDR family NAD(P)-dependent oxidoreductase n=1 Tax=Hymenobacter sp. 15J16-1T3B TaxID=2886941 RepID=UPI001D11A9EA|nr:SDR family NAD(P)-dependent oxidoreductase [Hymenobacter sp. 15J16-1T3B]MCC3158471.1 SDR family NAD(P)-dependent oxidoreductase [Hymenobacter sp. 15J16-1T3B]
MSTSSKSVVITGVSTGVGQATAQALLQRGYRVFGSLRRPADAEALRGTLGPQFTPLLFDVTDAAAVAAAAAQVEAALAGQPLTALINNAGVAFGGPLQHQPIEVVRQHFEVNVVGLVQVTQAFLPLLGARPGFAGTPGRVINIGSVSGQVAAPFVGAYVGSKHALEGLSATWRRELQLFGVDVVLIGLGVTQTPIWGKGIDLDAYRDTPYFAPAQRFVQYVHKTIAQGLTPAFVAERLVGILEARRPKVRYALVPDLLRAWVVPRLLPARWLDRLLGRGIGLLPPRRPA